MPFRESVVAGPVPVSWALDDDQQGLVAAAREFARERLEPLLGGAPDSTRWTETVQLAATLDLATMILPEQMGGMGISRHDLALVVEQFAAGPLERAAELTLSSVALMTLREYDALDRLPDPNIQHYLDGTTSIAPAIPDVAASGFWVLRQHASSQVLMVQMDGEHPQLALATLPARRVEPYCAVVTLPGALSIGRYTTAPPGDTPWLVLPDGGRADGNAVRQWLVDVATWLAALLSGAVRQGVNFALAYSAFRQTFRRPIAAHQLVAARLADMLISAHTIHLFLRSVAAQETQVQIGSVRSMAHHVATEALDVARELVQLCGGHGYVQGLPPAARFQTVHWFAMLLMKVEAALRAFTVTG
ncbi:MULTISPECIES: acyl-CoA dehydrogenase family protein [Burkholderia cepacia complex]|uniref:Acyl-CoA dehydrogenase n=1 Tax=Burkholderia pseudomultivorans TaxID=1207504 RepID=A0ABU2E5E9_9BURK|nr:MULTISPECIES: acyl-CoA dehydrogenase family protein [Burkholderia cepacia complex]MDN8068938.1 acyl-CoA dehydrogenase family protein [Burkholderia vietnamiensis]MDR8730051.1 Acyl-CoA dehydrogenase [Burkholderia pseudomultivorans]MDR8737503.1 Acyl-CoA dehydrogenase [Burkholderia pseudomultivorans]MDR8743788.1 Acyl-CoA dehydrogenase [Burkholderia pseudomultivorans]MDR8755098.1 Acyl-CoA dehydrogenase [Burkholderia pseudomultivorans]